MGAEADRCPRRPSRHGAAMVSGVVMVSATARTSSRLSRGMSASATTQPRACGSPPRRRAARHPCRHAPRALPARGSRRGAAPAPAPRCRGAPRRAHPARPPPACARCARRPWCGRRAAFPAACRAPAGSKRRPKPAASRMPVGRSVPSGAPFMAPCRRYWRHRPPARAGLGALDLQDVGQGDVVLGGDHLGRIEMAISGGVRLPM